MKKVLMLAFHYPPFGGGSGIHRTLKFSRYLPEYGWQPVVLSASTRAYPQTENKELVPDGVVLERAAALDTARHLSIRGAYTRWLAIPDRWCTWGPAAVVTGVRLIRKHRPDVLWSTYPIATAHWIGLALHRLTGIPWVADFRDPMIDTDPVTGDEYPTDPFIRRSYNWIESHTIKRCTRAVVTTPGTLEMYSARFPMVPHDRWALIPNGYDEEDFQAAEPRAQRRGPKNPLVLLHSGVIYPSERDPSAFFAALADLKQQGRISADNLRVVLRATGHDDFCQTQLGQLGIADIVRLEPPVAHVNALVEMMEVDGLLILQASNCNRQIPAKLYECLRARRPIFAMTDRSGDTAAALQAAGMNAIVPLDCKTQIADGLMKFLDEVRLGNSPIANSADGYSREARTSELASLLASACACK
jgi:glycosyltransferase involved in cell wall biosynthesis